MPATQANRHCFSSFSGKTKCYVFLILKLFLSMLSLFQVLTHSVNEEEIISRGGGRGVRVKVGRGYSGMGK